MDISNIISHEFKSDEFNLNDYKLTDIDSIEICNNDNKKFVDINVKDDHTVFATTNNEKTNIIFEQCDGAHIRAIYIAFFSKYAPSIIKEKRLCCLQLPLICMKDSKGNIIEMFQTFDDYNNWLKENKNTKLECKYYKGLGSWKDKEIKALVSKYGLSKFIEPLELDKDALKLIDDWNSKKTSDIRKEYLKENEFSIFGV